MYRILKIEATEAGEPEEFQLYQTEGNIVQGPCLARGSTIPEIRVEVMEMLDATNGLPLVWKKRRWTEQTKK